MIDFDPPIVAGTTLVRDAIQSQNFVPDISGWEIKSNGDATFTAVTIISTSLDGTITMADGEIDVRNSLGQVIALMTASGSGGFFTYNPSDPNIPFTALNSGQLVFGEVNRVWSEDGGIVTHAGVLTTDPIQTLISTGSGSVNSAAASISMESVANSVNGGGTGKPQIKLGSSDGSPTHIYIAGYASSIDYNTGNPDVWHTVGTAGSAPYNGTYSGSTTFNTTAGFPALKYRRDAENNVWIYGCFIAGSTPGTDIFTLPVGYRPLIDRAQLPVNFYDASLGTTQSGFMQVLTTGNLSVGGGTQILGTAIGAGDMIFVNGKFPIGELA